nr:RNA-directed DNA polymerase, eukaryota, reverse transcriptase zinc-binding domain protein [Tanacetum cinerariifolium]
MDTVQKSRIKWDVEGDENSKFFHGILKQKRHQQMVKGIMIDATVTMEEIRGAVWDCGSQKASGPYGFSFLFIKTYWELFKYDVEAAVKSFLDSFVMPKGANSSFITPIPKILANRLVKVVDKVVSHEQSAFISSRKILNGPIMLSKVMVWYKRNNKKLMMFKADFEKAFDTVSWKFLDHMLSSLSFGIKWRRWIQSGLQSARSCVLVNGIPSCEFPIKRGLRQGDPLSPFLFLIIMEVLHLALKDVVDAGMDLKGCKSRGSRNEEALEAMISEVGHSNVSNLPGSWQWNIAPDGVFSVHDTRLHLDNCLLPSLSPSMDLKGCKSRGNGSSIHFWKDNWVGNGPLNLRYNRLFHLDSNANCLLSERISNDNWSWNWNRKILGSRNEEALEAMISEVGHSNVSNLPARTVTL